MHLNVFFLEEILGGGGGGLQYSQEDSPQSSQPQYAYVLFIASLSD